MSRRFLLTLALAAAIAVPTVYASTGSKSPVTSKTSMPVPMCEPDVTSCGVGGPGVVAAPLQ